MRFNHIIFIAIIFFTFVFINTESKVQMGIITDSKYVGDREVAWRIKVAAERLGWEAHIDESGGKNLRMKKLDFAICMLPNNTFTSNCPIYLMIFHPFQYLDKNRLLLPFYEKYDGYLLTIHDRDIIRKTAWHKKKVFHFIPFYPTIYSTPYRELDFRDLVVMIPVWSNRLNDPKFKALYKLLSDSETAKFYGIQKNASMVAKGYMGSIPFDGVSVLEILQKHGIVLVFHSDIHNTEKIPSSRIFEAAAASNIIICDQNEFVQKHFGDSVFYIDTSLSENEIFDQIQQHLKTIKEAPEIAHEMAKKAHDIFIKNFTMENQLLKLEEMHKKIKVTKRG